jgi:subtilisin family serine protease
MISYFTNKIYNSLSYYLNIKQNHETISADQKTISADQKTISADQKTISAEENVNPAQQTDIIKTKTLYDRLTDKKSVYYNYAYDLHNILLAKQMFNTKYGYDLDGSTVSVVIFETGIVPPEEFKPQIGYFIDSTTQPYDINDYYDKNGHGTHVAGIIYSIAPKIKINCIDVYKNSIIFDSLKLMLDPDFYDPIINLSLVINKEKNINTFDKYVAILNSYSKKIVENGSIIICAAGNKSIEVSYPGKDINMLCVGAIDKNKELAYFSGTEKDKNTQKYAYTDAVSYGVDVYSFNNLNKSGLITKSGTSMATPQMSAITGLILDALIKSYYINKMKMIPSNLNTYIIKKAATYTYKNILFNPNYYIDIDDTKSILNGNNNDINGLCGRGLIQLDLVINDIINNKLRLL